MTRTVASACVSDEAVAALLDGRLSDDERFIVLEQVEGCDDCYELLVEVVTSVLGV